MTASRIDRIRSKIEAALDPEGLAITDDSHLHAGHAGARDGRGHFSVKVVANAFAGQSPIARHRMVYGAVGDMMVTDIHALAIDARTPQEDAGHS